MPSILKYYQIVFQSSWTIYISTSKVGGFQFVHILANTLLPILSYNYLSGYKVASRCGFDLLFFPLEKWLLKSVPNFKLNYFPFYCWLISVLYIFWVQVPYQLYDLQIFSPILWAMYSLYCWYPLKNKKF